MSFNLMKSVPKVTWDVLRHSIIDHRCTYPFVRKPEVHEQYQRHIQNIKANYNSIGDYIKVRHLRYNNTGGNFITKGNESLSFALVENDFPYDIDESIKHFVFWSIYENDINNLQIALKKFWTNKDNLLWFENELSNKSVTDLWHVQVFIYDYKYTSMKNNYTIPSLFTMPIRMI